MYQLWDNVAETVQFTAPLNFAAFRERVPLNARVLDIGCGYGRVSDQLRLAGFATVKGYDGSKNMVKRARMQYPMLDICFADAANVPEPDGHFDAVVVSALFTCIPEQQKRLAVAAEIRRVLKRDGTVHGVDFLREPRAQDGAFTSTSGIAMWHFEPNELRCLFPQFTGWDSWKQKVLSRSGGPSTVLQYVAYAS